MKVMAKWNEILRCLVGSTAHGTGLPGHEDRDEMGVCIEPQEVMLGLEHFEQWEYRSAAERDGQSAPSTPDDLDLTIYGLRKYLGLAMKGNPSILLALYAPPLNITRLGTELRDLAPQIASRKAGARFAGYLKAQTERMLGTRGGRHGGHRPDLVAQFGFDTKFAMHAVRLGYQGVEYLKSGRISVPMQGDEAERCKAIRRGEVPIEKVVAQAMEFHGRVLDLADNGPLPDVPDYKAVNDWMIHAYLTHWGVS